MNKLKYSIHVYEDHAIINGCLSSDILILLVRLCKKHGFTHLTSGESGIGFKLIRLEENDNL